MGFPFSRFLRKTVKGDDETAPEQENDSQAQDAAQSPGATASSSASPSSGEAPPKSSSSSPIQTNRLQDRIVKPIPIREPKSQKQQKKISARIHIPPISLRQPDDDPVEFKTTPRTSLPPAPRKGGNAARTPLPRRTRRVRTPDLSAKPSPTSPTASTEAQDGEENVISAPFAQETPQPQTQEKPDAHQPEEARQNAAPESSTPLGSAPERPPAKQETHRQLPSNFRVGTPATPSLRTPATPQPPRERAQTSAQEKPSPSVPTQSPSPPPPTQAAKATPAPRQQAPGSHRLKLPSRPPILSVPPKFGPRVDEQERDDSSHRGEIHLKKSAAESPPESTDSNSEANEQNRGSTADNAAAAAAEPANQTAASIPEVPKQSKELFADKIRAPKVPQQAERPQLSPQQKLTSNVPPVPRRPEATSRKEKHPEAGTQHADAEYISFEQAEKEFGPLQVNGNGNHDQQVSVPSSNAPGIPSERQTSAVAPLPRRETARIPLPRNRFSRSRSDHTRQTAAPRISTPNEGTAPEQGQAEQNGHHPTPAFTSNTQFDNPVLREIFLTDDPLDLDKIAQLTTDFPGITHCLIILQTPDGQQLAGSLPTELDQRKFSQGAMALAEKINNSTQQLSMGKSQALTLYCETGIISFFTGAQICVSVKHHQRGFLPGVREKLQRVTEELGNILLTSTSN